MRQQLVKNLAFVLAINLMVKAVWIFGIDRTVQITVGYTEYGKYQALLNLALIFQIVLDFGLTQYASKTIAAQPNLIASLFASMLWVRVLLSIAYIIFVYTVGWFLGYSQVQLALLVGVLLIMVLNATMVFLRANIAALHYFKLDGVLAVVDRLLMIIVCGLLLLMPQWAMHFNIEWFIWAQILCYALAVMVALIALMRISPGKLVFGFNGVLIKKVLVESAPYALLVFLMSVYMRADSVMIERLCGNEGAMQAGIYASAFRLLDVANIFGVMFAGMLMPLFSRMLAQQESVALLVRTSVDVMMPVAFVVAVISWAYGADIMSLLYPHKSGDIDAQIFSILMCSFPAYCLMYIYSTLLTAKGSIRLLNKISLLVVILNVSLHFVMISHYKALGAASVVLVCEWFVAALVIYFAHQQCNLPHNYKWLLRHLVFVITIAAFAFVLQFFSWSWMGQILILLTIAFGLLFVLQLWSLKQLRNLLSHKVQS